MLKFLGNCAACFLENWKYRAEERKARKALAPDQFVAEVRAAWQLPEN